MDQIVEFNSIQFNFTQTHNLISFLKIVSDLYKLRRLRESTNTELHSMHFNVLFLTNFNR